MDAIINSDDAQGFHTVDPATLKAGDLVADTFGGKHVVRRVLVLKDGMVRLSRVDGWVDFFLPGERVTVPD